MLLSLLTRMKIRPPVQRVSLHITLLTLLILAFAVNAFPEQLPIRTYTTVDGLVVCIGQFKMPSARIAPQ